MKRAILMLVVVLATTGCSHQQFDRFMDHPILSWAPFTQADIDGLNPLYKPKRSTRRLDPDCQNLARERSEFLDRNQFSDSEIAEIFTRTYSDCVAEKKRLGS